MYMSPCCDSHCCLSSKSVWIGCVPPTSRYQLTSSLLHSSQRTFLSLRPVLDSALLLASAAPRTPLRSPRGRLHSLILQSFNLLYSRGGGPMKETNGYAECWSDPTQPCPVIVCLNEKRVNMDLLYHHRVQHRQLLNTSVGFINNNYNNFSCTARI